MGLSRVLLCRRHHSRLARLCYDQATHDGMKELGMNVCHEDLFPGMAHSLEILTICMGGAILLSFFAGLYREQEPAMYGWMGWSLKTRILMTFGQRLAIELPLDAYMRVWGEIISLSL